MTIHNDPIVERSGRPGWFVEATVIIALVVTALCYGRFAFFNATTLPDFYWMAPAVMVATGQGFQSPAPAVGTPLSDFLRHRRNALDVKDAVPVSFLPPDDYWVHRYLLLTVGYWWKIVGIKWSALADIAAVLHVLAVIGSYALFRLFLGRGLSLVGALWVCTSALQLSFIPHLRDYSKGAFILPVLALTVVLALRATAFLPALAVSAATGLLIGVGFGFRADVAIMVPVALMAIWLFRGRFPWTSLPEKAAATIALALGLMVSAGPVLYRMSSGGSNAHVLLLGYADEFDSSLGVAPSVYRFLPFYNDKYLEAAVNAFDQTRKSVLRIGTAEYDSASRKLWYEILTRFPADVFVRVLASTNSVLNLAFAPVPRSVFSREALGQDYFLSLNTWLNRWNGWGGLAGAAFIAVAAIVSVRQALLAVLCIAVLAGYPSLQFGSRHFFHLQVIPVFVLLVLFRAATVALWSIRWNAASRARVRVWFDSGALSQVAGRLAFAAGVPVLATILLLSALRQYQSKHMQGLITEFLDQTRIPILQEPLLQTGGLWLARPSESAGSIQSSKSFQYYELEFRPENARSSPIIVGLRYRPSSPDTEFSRVLSVASGRGVTRLGLPVFSEAGQFEFEGIQLGVNAMRRLNGIYLVPSGGPGHLPIDLMLPPNWSDTDLFQRLALESPSESESDPRVSLLTTGSPSNSERISRFDRLLSNDRMEVPPAAWAAKSVNVTPSSISMDHRAESKFSYLVQFEPTEVKAGAALIVEGRVDAGGIAIGLLKDKTWSSQIIIGQRGRFAAVLPVDQSGTYVPMITNAMPDGESRNRFHLTRFGFTQGIANSSSDRTPTRTAR